jgi:hypothetical protein
LAEGSTKMAVPTLLQCIGGCTTSQYVTANGSTQTYAVELPDPSKSGNLIVVCCNWNDTPATVVSVVDDKSGR